MNLSGILLSWSAAWWWRGIDTLNYMQEYKLQHQQRFSGVECCFFEAVGDCRAVQNTTSQSAHKGLQADEKSAPKGNGSPFPIT